MYPQEGYNQSWKLEYLTDCFSFRTVLACQRNTPYLPWFSSVRNTHLMENMPVMLNGRDTCKCWNNSMEVGSLRVFDNVLLLELSLNFQ
jgi:hypothetical protein